MTNIMLIDDDRITRYLYSSILGKHYTIQEFADPAELLAELRNSRPDLLLTDYNMPHKDGITLVREVKIMHPDLKCVMATSEISDALREEAKEAGIDHVFDKNETAGTRIYMKIKEVLER